MDKQTKTPPLIIMISGKARSGKDTIASIIRNELETGIYGSKMPFFSKTAVIGFADMLKALCNRNHGYKSKKDDREILLRVGDEMRGEDIHAFSKPLVHFIDIYRNMGYGTIVVTDHRYRDEFEHLNLNSSGIPYLIRIDSVNAHNGVSEETKSHRSEELNFEYDFLLPVPELTKDTYPALVTEVRRILTEIVDDYAVMY